MKNKLPEYKVRNIYTDKVSDSFSDGGALGVMATGYLELIGNQLDHLKNPHVHDGLLVDIDATKLNSDELYRLTMYKLYGSCIANLMNKQEELSPN